MPGCAGRGHAGLLRPGPGCCGQGPGCCAGGRGQPPGCCAGIGGCCRPGARLLLRRHALLAGPWAGLLRHTGCCGQGPAGCAGGMPPWAGQVPGCCGQPPGCCAGGIPCRRHARLARPGPWPPGPGPAGHSRPAGTGRSPAARIGATIRLGRPLNLEAAVGALEGVHIQENQELEVRS